MALMALFFRGRSAKENNVDLQEVNEKIAVAEMRWKQSIGITKAAYKEVCDKLYAEKRVLEEAAIRDKVSRN